MKRATIAAAIVALIGTAASAQQSESLSQSQSSSGIIMNGSPAINNTPGMAGGAGNSTAPCVVANGFGTSMPGFGIMVQTGVINGNCELWLDASNMQGLINSPPSAGRTAAIYAICANRKDLRPALVAAGACVVKSR